MYFSSNKSFEPVLLLLKNTSSSSLPIKFLQEEKGKSQRHKEGRGSNAQKKRRGGGTQRVKEMEKRNQRVSRDAGKMSDWKMEAAGGDKDISELEREMRGGWGVRRREGKRREEKREADYSELVLPHQTGSSGLEMLWGQDFCEGACECVNGLVCVFSPLFFVCIYKCEHVYLYCMCVCACVCLDKRMCTPFLFVFVCKEHHWLPQNRTDVMLTFRQKHKLRLLKEHLWEWSSRRADRVRHDSYCCWVQNTKKKKPINCTSHVTTPHFISKYPTTSCSEWAF